MRLKLDENLGWRIAEGLRDAGHDVATVRDEELGGADDDALFARCRQEGRCLVTLDLDFSNVLRFPPEQTEGLAVLRPAGRPTLAALGRLAGQLVEALSRESVAGRLWIIEPGRIQSTSHRRGSEDADVPSGTSSASGQCRHHPRRAEGPSLTMEPCGVPLDWDELELALEMRSDEWASYLDVRTGEICVSRIDPFGGEREDHELTDEEVEAGLANGTLIAVEPLESSVEYAWMAAFADAVPGARVRRALQQVLGGSRPFRRFKDALAAHPREREEWFAFRRERLRDTVRKWLADHNIEPTTKPPARSGQAAQRGAP